MNLRDIPTAELEAEITRLKTELATAIRAQKKAEEEKASLESHFEMYRKAWKRELGNKFFAKSHEIDALVLTTEYHYKRSQKHDDLMIRLGTATTLIAELMDALLNARFRVLDLKKGFHWGTKPAEWVKATEEPMQAALKSGTEKQPIIAPKP